MEHYNNTHNYLMYFKSKRIMDSNFQSSMDLCEDQAPFEGFIWPLRSYSCSFCRREFQSAQAIGGHMNVHRRDRARLKQSPSPQVLSEKSETLLLQQERASQSPSESHRIGFLDVKNFSRKVTNHPTFLADNIGAHEIDSSVVIDRLFAETTDCKKRKKTCVTPSPISHGTKACSSNRYGKISPVEDIDLELRLGDPRTVK